MKNRLLFTLFILCSLHAFTQKNYWHSVLQPEALRINSNSAFFKNGFQPATYKLFTLAEKDFAASLLQSATQKSNGGIIVYLPVAKGNIEKFSIQESSVMEPALQAKFTNIHTYIGRGIDDPNKTIACSYSPLGFHASIMGIDEKTIYLNPVNNKSQLYAVFARNNNDKSENKLKCATEKSFTAEKIAANTTAPTGNADDGILRTYRLALCTTGEWSLFFMTGTERTHMDSINTVLAALAVDLVRANQVYERDLGIHMNFAANEDTLIFLNPSTDPFTLVTLNSKCQQTCDNRIGNANYDIGHVVAKGSDNGSAGCIGCVCKTGTKGSGMSTYSNPDLSDYFVVDYWTHEMGHQYGANHTFTCYNEGTSAQIEPGSGSTIMGYAGITGGTDVQDHSDDLFSAASIAQISKYIKPGGGGNACAVSIVTGDHAPTANAGADYIIPISTPFILTGKATDADKSDVLSYIWEQTDAYESGANTYPKTTTIKGPEYRTYNYSSSPVRMLPADTTVIRGAAATKWEALSTVSRDLNFRFTVRDNHVGGGNNKSDDMFVGVTNISGPFVITSPNATVSWTGGTTKVVTWNVANTTAAPVSCTRVKVMLSYDGGKTFSKVLKTSTPNDGNVRVIIPDIATTHARIGVFALNNIFFDISNVNFTIKTSGIVATNAIEAATAKKINCIISPNPAKDFLNVLFNTSAKTAIIILSDANGKVIFNKNFQTIVEGQTENISLRNFAKGNYFLKITTEAGTQLENIIIQ